MDIHSIEYIQNQSDKKLSFFEVDSLRYYMLAGTDQAENDSLIYDFSLEYLRLRPNDCISLYGDSFFFLKDLEKLESEGGYYIGWCYKPTHKD